MGHSWRSETKVLALGEIRQEELLTAAFTVMKRDGLAGTTVSKIAEEIDVSKGIVHHYFINKHELIFRTMRYAHAIRRKAIVDLLRAARSPRERLAALIEVNLGETYLHHDYCSLWISFAAEALNDADFARLLQVIHRREQSNLFHALRQIVSKQDAQRLLPSLQAIIEACRLWSGHPVWTGNIGPWNSAHARALAYSLLKHKIPGFGQPANS
jgi:TetR/AcrR family transcriptional repressor of bet genes